MDDQTDVITFCALTRRRIVSALWQVFLQKQLEVWEGKDKVLAMWTRDVITHDLGRRAPFIDVVAPGCARVLMSARSRSSHVFAVFKFFQAHPVFIPRWCLHRVHYACTHWVSLASWHCGTTFWPRPVGGSLASAVQPVLPSRGRCFRTDVAVTLVAGIGGPAADVAGLVARPLPLGEMARVVAQLGCDRGLHQHVPLRVPVGPGCRRCQCPCGYGYVIIQPYIPWEVKEEVTAPGIILGARREPHGTRGAAGECGGSCADAQGGAGGVGVCCEMHVSHAFHMHEPGTDARIWTCDVWWAAHIGAAHIGGHDQATAGAAV